MSLKEWPTDNEDKVPGKDFRGLLIQSFNSVIKVPKEKLVIITKAVEMLHTASLLIDDVEDSATLRRGYPVAHALFGTAQTINSSNYVYFLALQEILKLKSDIAITIYSEELINLHRGQGLDLYWRDALECPTEEEYIQMVLNKTGGLYRLAVRLMQVVGTSNIDLIPLADIFGIIYQIRDDYLNLQSENYSKNKGFCEDLTEGKFSFPIIHSIRADQSNKELLNILKQKTSDVVIKQYAIDYMRNSTRSFEYTNMALLEYRKQAESFIASIEDENSGELQEILHKMLSIS